MTQRVVITGLGVVSSIGIGWESYWQALLGGKSGIGKINYLDTSEFDTHIGGELKDFSPGKYFPTQQINKMGRGSQFAAVATKLALKDAGFVNEQLLQKRVAVCLGTTMADIQALEAIDDYWVRGRDSEITSSLVTQYPSCMMSIRVAELFGFNGPVMMIPTACAAGNYAIGYGYDLLKQGRADIAIAGGADPFSRIAFTGFSRLFALAPEMCQPFDLNRQGTLIGEGAGILILERLEAARNRKAEIFAEVLGIGYSCDGRHMTIPEIDGIERVIKNALSDAGIDRSDVHYISAHGTGTPANDRAEASAIRKLFGSYADGLPVSSIKSMIGHTMGAASALEAIACALVVKNDMIPPTINHVFNDPDCAIDCVPNEARQHRAKVVLNNSFAFGGNNACLVLGKVERGGTRV